MLGVGDIVRVKPPFDETYPGTYPIVEIVTAEDGGTVYVVDGHGGFDAVYLERA